MAPLVDGVDHVYVPMADAEAAFAVLTDQLGLPALWPFTSFGRFASGGVSVGSIKLEIIAPSPTAPWSDPQDPPQIQGIAFRPAAPIDDAYLAEVDARGLAHTAPEHFERGGRPTWTNFYFTDLISTTAGAFVCDYHLPQSRDLTRRREVLQACGGGELGVVDAVELVIDTADLDLARQRWQRLLDPPQSDDAAMWRPMVGPTITLKEDLEERVGDLVLQVRAEAAAEAAWQGVAEGLLAGFPLRFTEQREPTG